MRWPGACGVFIDRAIFQAATLAAVTLLGVVSGTTVLRLPPLRGARLPIGETRKHFGRIQPLAPSKICWLAFSLGHLCTREGDIPTKRSPISAKPRRPQSLYRRDGSPIVMICWPSN